jgi:hypothetical protein
MITVTKEEIGEQLAVSAFRYTSFDPEKRGASAIQGFMSDIEDLCAKAKEAIEKGADPDRVKGLLDESKPRLIKSYQAWLSARSRTASSMITGPANFPVRRNEKANNVERKRLNEYCALVDRIKNKIKWEIPRPKTEVNFSEIEKDLLFVIGIDKGLAKGYDRRLFLGSIQNKIERLHNNGKYDEVLAAIQVVEKYNTEGPKTLFTDRNKLWKLKASAEEKRAVVETITEPETHEGFKVINNTEEDRIQIIFNDKPNEKIRELLKRNGYKWSPRFSAWQRQNTPNGLHMTEQIVKVLPKYLNII